MSEGHRHRVLKTRIGGFWDTVLRTPTIARSIDYDKVEASRWMWGPTDPDHVKRGSEWRLTPLGVLHTLCGLTLDYPDSKTKT